MYSSSQIIATLNDSARVSLARSLTPDKRFIVQSTFVLGESSSQLALASFGDDVVAVDFEMQTSLPPPPPFEMEL